MVVLFYTPISNVGEFQRTPDITVFYFVVVQLLSRVRLFVTA